MDDAITFACAMPPAPAERLEEVPHAVLLTTVRALHLRAPPSFLAAPIDKVKDWFASFPTEDEMADAKEELKYRDHDAAAGRAAAAGH